jgi:hypothetical protein
MKLFPNFRLIKTETTQLEAEECSVGRPEMPKLQPWYKAVKFFGGKAHYTLHNIIKDFLT